MKKKKDGLKELLHEIELYRLEWEKDHFGDDEQKKSAFYKHVLDVLNGMDC